MRVTGTCWSTAALAAGFVGIAWASISENEKKSARPGKSSSTPQDRLDGQKIVAGAVPAGVTAENEETTLELEDASESTVDSIQKILVTTTTSETAVTISYAKITEAPSLFKRKLGSTRWDLIHEGIQGQKRDATSCPVDYQLCPKSVGGGCCPNDRLCDTSSCLPTTPGPSTACGQVGYVACGQDDGGGCCPGGYVCGQAGCSPSAGVSATETCGANSYLCPASLNYGCCKNGMGCALKGCYTTSVQTYTLTSTLTTTDASSHAVTVTTAIQAVTTPVAPTATASTEGNLIPKVQATPTAIAKTPASGTPSSNNGLSKAEIGGIIGGAVAFLVVILIIAFFILRRLNTAIKAASDRQSRTSSSQARSGRSRPRAANTPDIDAMSVDPLMITGSESGSTTRHGSYQASQTPSSVHEVDGNSPPTFNYPFSPRSPPHTHYPRGYNPVAPSESAYSNNSSGYRNPSLESTPPMAQTGRGYFDISLRPERNSQGSLNRRPSQHGRNWSNASEESEVSAASSGPGPVELDGNPERKNSFQSALQRFGMGRMVSGRRRASDSPVLTGGPTSSPPAYVSPTSPRLGHIPEAGESRDHIEAHPGMSGLTGVQLREAGLSNSQLREMTLFEHGPYPPEKTWR